MAWVFDITPEGVKLDAGVSGGKGLFAAAALLIVLALGWYFYGQPSFRKGDIATPSIADPNSIRVLPFANISGKADQDYFSDGMTEELLNVSPRCRNSRSWHAPRSSSSRAKAAMCARSGASSA